MLNVSLANLGATVYETPSYYDVNQRASFANGKNANILLSIHFNGGVNTVTGVEAYYRDKSYVTSGSKEKDIEFCLGSQDCGK